MTITKSRAGKAFVALFAAMFMVFTMSASTFAAQKPKEDKPPKEEVKKVLICHATMSNPRSEKPYRVNNVDVNGLNGHDEHIGDEEAGVVWNNMIHKEYKDNKIEWGDIIPPTGKFEGLNWDKYGRAVYENDCNYVEAVTAKPVTFVNPTCDTKGTYTVPTTEGVEYYIGDKVVAAGTYTVESDTTVTVTAKALKGYVLSDESKSEWSNKFVTPTDCDEDVVTPPTDGPSDVLADLDEPQVAVTPVGAADAGGAGTTALVGLVGSTLAVSLGAVIRKFSL